MAAFYFKFIGASVFDSSNPNGDNTDDLAGISRTFNRIRGAKFLLINVLYFIAKKFDVDVNSIMKSDDNYNWYNAITGCARLGIVLLAMKLADLSTEYLRENKKKQQPQQCLIGAIVLQTYNPRLNIFIPIHNLWRHLFASLEKYHTYYLSHFRYNLHHL